MEDSRMSNAIMAASVESGKAMGSAAKDGGKDDGLAELFKLNQVWYRMPPSLSLVSKRTITRCNFQQTSYNAPLNQQISSVIFNTGEFQVSGPTSFLVLQIGIDKSDPSLSGIFSGNQLENKTAWTSTQISLAKSTVRAFLGQGGILNLIDEVTFLSASGTEVDRQQNKGLQVAHVTRNTRSQDWYDTAGELQGYPGGPFMDNYDSKGFPGQVNPGTGSTTSPYLIPTRSSWDTDYSKVFIDQQNSTTSNTSAVPSSSFDSTKFSPSYVGSVDISFDSTFNSTYNPTVGQAPYFIIPLSELLGCFKPYMNALIPSQALAGGRMEIRWKNMTEALIATGPGFDGTVSAIANNSAISTPNASAFLNACRVYNCYFLLDSFQMNDSVLKKLNEVAAGNEGLTVMFDTWDWTQTPVSGLSFEAQVSQARSRITRSFCVIRDQFLRTDPFANSLASEAAVNRATGQSKIYSLTNANANSHQLMVNSYQAQLGSLYFPQQPLQTLEEYVMNSYYTFSRNYCTEQVSAVTLSEFMGANGQNIITGTGPNATVVIPYITSQEAVPTDAQRTYTQTPPYWCLNWGSATYGFLAERSQLLQLTGLPISNARLLRHRFNVNYSEASGTGRVVDVFTEYTRLMKVFLGGRIVMRE